MRKLCNQFSSKINTIPRILFEYQHSNITETLAPTPEISVMLRFPVPVVFSAFAQLIKILGL
jgi:hypothetical protein